MKRTAFVFGALGGVLVAVLKAVEYRFLVVEHSLEIYGGLVALVFSAVGLWLGLTLAGRRRDVIVREVPVLLEVPPAVTVPAALRFVRNAARQAELGITAREVEILELIAAGLSNREIAERLFVSENTVKTHSGRLFDKLAAKRRTQAVQRARDAGLVP
jgi:two-component system, NarL family, response regulator LiaR